MSTSPEEGREASFFTTVRSWGLVRTERRVFGGVLSGVGNRIGMAPAPARLLFVLLCILTGGGIGVLAYAAAWALLPDHEGRIVVQDFGRGVPQAGQLVAIIVMAIIGFFTFGDLGPGWLFGFDGSRAWFTPSVSGAVNFGVAALTLLIPLVILGAIVAVIVWAVRGSRKPSATSVAGLGAANASTTPDAGTAAAAAASSDASGSGDGAGSAQAAAAPAGAVATAPPVYAAVPPVYAAPRPPKPPRIPGAGPVAWLLTLALVPLSLAIAYWMHYQDLLAVHPILVAGLIWVAGLGLIIAGAALSGRRVGGLGTFAAFALIPTLAIAANADDLLRPWPDHNWDDPVAVIEDLTPGIPPDRIDPEVPEPPAAELNPATTFADYSFVQINGYCWSEPGVQPTGAVVSLGSVTDAMVIDVTASETRVIVPSGTSLQINVSDDWESYGSLYWVDRDVACAAPGTPGTWAKLTNGDAPVVTLRLSDAAASGSIYIEEN